MATTSSPMVMSIVDDELLQAEAKLWCEGFGYLRSMALQCAIKLGIPNAIHRLGGVASLSELHAAVPIATSKRPCLSRLLRFLATSGILMEVETPADAVGGGGGDTSQTAVGPYYRQTTASRLLVDDDEDEDEDDAGRRRRRHRCLSPFMVMITSPFFVAASQSLADWLLEKEDEDDGAVAATAGAAGHGHQSQTPFAVAHGEDLYGFLARDASPSFSACFKKGLGSDSGFVVDIVVRACAQTQVLAGVTSLVDVGGGNGTMATAIAKAFPHVRCSVLELPYVVDAAPADSPVEFVAGDMMEFIPPADVVFFKSVLLNWSDEECIRILKRAKEAISTGEAEGKVIIVDVVLGYPSNKQASEAQLSLDLTMMVATTGKLRGEETWHMIFISAGFTRYKIVPGLGIRSLIEVYP